MKSPGSHTETEVIKRFRNNIANHVAYEGAYNLFLKITTLTQRVERTMEKVMVMRLSEASIDLMIAFYKFQTTSEKTKVVADACKKIEEVQLLLRLIKDFKLIAVFYISDLEDHVRKISDQIHDECRMLEMKKSVD